jgi:hypothetical protein
MTDLKRKFKVKSVILSLSKDQFRTAPSETAAIPSEASPGFIVVEMKTELDKLREQVQNIE